MIFPGGEVHLPHALLSDGRTGIGGERVYPPEEHLPMSRIPTRSLERLHDELGALAAYEPEGPLRDYMTLVELQCAAELTGRMNR